MKIEEIIRTLRLAFKNEEIKRKVLTTHWLELNTHTGIHSTGFCYTASEVLYKLSGGNQVWQVKSLKDPKHWTNGTHYFLVRKIDEKIFDITADQYLDRDIAIPYGSAVGSPFRITSLKSRLLADLAGLGNL